MYEFPFPKINDQFIAVTMAETNLMLGKAEGLLPKLTYHSFTTGTVFFLFIEATNVKNGIPQALVPWALALEKNGTICKWVVGSDKVEAATIAAFYPIDLMSYCNEFLSDVQYYVNNGVPQKERIVK